MEDYFFYHKQSDIFRKVFIKIFFLFQWENIPTAMKELSV